MKTMLRNASHLRAIGHGALTGVLAGLLATQ